MIEPGPEADRFQLIKCLGWVLAGSLTLLYLFQMSHSVPDHDYFSVMHVINNLRTPGLFGDSRLTGDLTTYHVTTAPVYYYGLALPLSFLLETKWVLFLIGIVFTLFSYYFAGANGNSYADILTSLLVLIFLLQHHVTPLEGNRRSFISVCLLGILWLDEDPSFLSSVFLVAVASGIYPPVALLVLGYLTLLKLKQVFQVNRPGKDLLYLIGYYSTFLLVLSPYLLNQFISSSSRKISGWVAPIGYNFASVHEFLSNLMVGHRYSLFRYQPFYDFLVVFTVLVLLEYLILENSPRIRQKYALMFFAALLAWGLANVFHPYLYQPFKYTRVTLPLIGLLIFADNLPLAVETLFQADSPGDSAKACVFGLGIMSFGIWLGNTSGYVSFDFLHEGIRASNVVWKFMLGIVFSFAILLVLKQLSFESRSASFIIGLVLVGGIYLPQLILPTSLSAVPGDSMPFHREFYRSIRTTPPGALIAGPPGKMNSVPAFSKRAVYATTEQKKLTIICERVKELAEVYFSRSPAKIYSWLQEQGIDYLLVDRDVLNGDGFGICGVKKGETREAYLNQDFQNVLWEHENRYYLVHRDNLLTK